MHRRQGFSLIELMIVVAIIGILASIAMPNMIEMQYRAKRSELPANIDGIQMAQIAYDASMDHWIEVPDLQPDAAPGKPPRDWVSGSGFDTLGWQPDGQVRGSYKVVSVSAANFVVTGVSDVDGDGVQARYTATKTVNAAVVTNHDVY